MKNIIFKYIPYLTDAIKSYGFIDQADYQKLL